MRDTEKSHETKVVEQEILYRKDGLRFKIRRTVSSLEAFKERGASFGGLFGPEKALSFRTTENFHESKIVERPISDFPSVNCKTIGR